MADLYLDIRNRAIRAIVAEDGETKYQQAYRLDALENENRERSYATALSKLHDGELTAIIDRIRTESPVKIEQAHLVLPNGNVKSTTHRLPRMPQAEAYKLVLRKIVEETHDEFPQIGLIPMAAEQNSQTWLSEYIPTGTLRDYKKDFSAAGIKLKTVSTIPQATLKTIAHIRESIFNAHAIFEINATYVEIYYVSASALLLHETLEISDEDNRLDSIDQDRILKRRMFTILDMLYHVNAQYQAANPMTPLEKIWVCGSDANIPAMSSALQDAMDVETIMLNDQADDPITGCRFAVLRGFVRSCVDGTAVNFMHPDLLSRFPLRRRSGLLIYISTILLTASVMSVTEYRHTVLKNRLKTLEKTASAQKTSKTESDSIVKNIEILKKLSARQIVLYPVFRELAMKMPDGVYLDSLVFSGKDDQSTIDLSASFRQPNDPGAGRTLTRLTETFTKSPHFVVTREPTVTTAAKDGQTVVTVKISCEVRPRDQAK